MLILPRFKDLAANRSIILPGPSVAGFFKMDAIRPDGRVRPLMPWTRNLVTDQGLDNIGEVDTWTDFCHVGTGSTPPQTTDTQLDTWLATAGWSGFADTNGNSGSSPWYKFTRRIYRFAQGAAQGTIAEVGIGPTNVLLTSRSLVNPVVPVQADEILDVTWEVRFYQSEVDATGSILLDGTSYDYIVRTHTAGGQAPQQTLLKTGAGTNNPSGSGDHDISANIEDAYLPDEEPGATIAAYVPGQYLTPITIQCGVDSSNYGGGLRSLDYQSNRNFFNMRFGDPLNADATIPKDNTKTLDITLAVAWARQP
jgi:hypothetical protein